MFRIYPHMFRILSSRAKRGICSLPNIKPIARQLGSTDGAEIAEAALVLPLVAMLLFGIIWFGRAFNIYSTIQQAAQQGAITAARATCATCGNTPATDATVTGAVEAVMKSSNIDTTQILANAPSSPLFCASPPYPAGACNDHGRQRHHLSQCSTESSRFHPAPTMRNHCELSIPVPVQLPGHSPQHADD